MITHWEWRKATELQEALPPELYIFHAGVHAQNFHCVHSGNVPTEPSVLAIFQTETMGLTEDDKRLACDLCYARFGGA